MFKSKYIILSAISLILFLGLISFISAPPFGYNYLPQKIFSTSSNSSGGTYNDAWINDTFYNKTETDVLIAGAGGGGGSSFNPLQYNPSMRRQLAPLSTTDNVTWSDSDMKFDLVGGTMYYLQCDILYTGQAATTGMVINVSKNGSHSNSKVVYDTWSSATAKVGLSAVVFNTNLIGTGSGATIIKPNFIVADWNQTTNGTLILKFRSEIFGSIIQIERGSVCYLYNVGNLQEFSKPIPTNNTPAIRRQTVNIATTSNSAWSVTNLSFNVEASKTYNMQCDILYTGQAATTGQTLNITTNVSYSNAVISYDTWSSATAKVGLSAIVFNTALIGTGSGATIIKPNGLYVGFTTSTGGYINVTFRSEISASASTLINGSVCKLYDLT